MTISSNGLALLVELEGCILHIYKDSARLPTIGVGHLICKGEDFSNGITQDEATELLRHDLVRFEAAVNTCKVKLSQNQYDALVCFAFNIGAGGFLKSSALRVLNTGNYTEVPNKMRMWNKITINGKMAVSKGLVNRREKEIELYLA